MSAESDYKCGKCGYEWVAIPPSKCSRCNQPKNLYHIQDSDRPMWVVATSWSEAISLWKKLISLENDQALVDVEECQGIQLVCMSGELIFEEP